MLNKNIKSKSKLSFIIYFSIIIFTVITLYSSIIIELVVHKTYFKPNKKVSLDIQKFHKALFISDLHADSLLWNRDLTERSSRGHVDIPRLIEGNVTLQAFTIVSRVSFNMNMHKTHDYGNLISLLQMVQGQSTKTWFNNYHKVMQQIQRLKLYEKNSLGRLRLVYTGKDLDNIIRYKKINPGVVAGIIGLEGLYPLEENLGNFDLLYDAGVRMMALTHFQDTIFAGSGQGEHKGGLTKRGVFLIEKMKKKNLVIDLAHLSEKASLDILSMVKKPVVVSHTGVKGTCNSKRNLSDKVIKAIAKNGGVIGIAFFKHAICGSTLGSIIRAMAYVRNLVGINTVALGSDFDGSVKNVIAANQMLYLTEALLHSKSPKFSKSDVKKIMGENTLRVLRKNL